MPAKPRWYSHISEILAQLNALPRPWVDRAAVEFLLGVGPRRAQQLMAPCVRDSVGSSGLVDRDQFVAYLGQLARGEPVFYERQRRRGIAQKLDQWRQRAVEQPRVLIEASPSILNQKLSGLPAGVRLEPGRITVEFEDSDQALKKLLALAMAIGNDQQGFEAATRLEET